MKKTSILTNPATAVSRTFLLATPWVVPAAELEAPDVPIMGPCNRIRIHTSFMFLVTYSNLKEPCTFEAVLETSPESSTARLLMELKSRTPSGFASTLMPFSLVETASRFPSLLNLTQGET